jgi:signal transduction histidine kinase
MEPRLSGRTLRTVMQQRERLGRSVVQNQLLASGTLLLLSWIVILVRPVSLSEPLLFGGLILAFVVTGVALAVPWGASNRRWIPLLPALDIVAITAVRAGEPSLGTGLLLVFPVLWLSRFFSVRIAFASVAFSTVLLWATWLLRGDALQIGDFPSLVLLPITLAAVATTSFISARRTRGQRVLLRQQAEIVENAFDRARRQETLLDEILNSVSFGVIAFDRDGQVTLMNEAHRRSLIEYGAPRASIMHPEMYQADRHTPYPVHYRPLARAIAGQEFENLTVWVGPPDGHQAAFSVTSRRLTTPSGEPDGGVLVLRDVTAELGAIAARDRLIGSVSHELRSPLTSIIGYLDLASEDETLADDTRRMLGISLSNSERLLALVTDLLLAASEGATDLPVTFERTDISRVVDEAVDAQRLAAEERSIRVHTEIEPEAIASADPVRIRQVLDNLISNAIKYNRQNGEIGITVSASEDTVSVSVRDTGDGLSEADRAQLFERFFRTESARASSAVGSGLGLSISREIVRQHAGDLTVQSEVGVGTTFTMTIPREAA